MLYDCVGALACVVSFALVASFWLLFWSYEAWIFHIHDKTFENLLQLDF